LRSDPGQSRDVSTANAERFLAMKAALRRHEAAQGHYEATDAVDSGDRPWPPPLRRGLAGDGDAAIEIAELLDDSDVRFRRKAAELLFELKRKEAAPRLQLALARDEDPVVRRMSALALARLGQTNDLAVEALHGPDREAQRAAALALAENGDGRAGPALVEWWQAEHVPYPRAREILAALAAIRSRNAVIPLIAALSDLRLRPHVAQTLAAIGHPAARAPIAEWLAKEQNHDTRAALADALVRLGAKAELAPLLVRFLGTPDPIASGVAMARRSGLLATFGSSEADLARLRAEPDTAVSMEIEIGRKREGGYRLLARAAPTDGQPGTVTFTPCRTGTEQPPDAPQTLHFARGSVEELFFTLPWISTNGHTAKRASLCLTIARTANLALEGVAVVPLADDLPPPPPEPWEAPPEQSRITPH
jgi:hypothetical protein